MREWLEAQLAAGLPALAGSSVSGTLAVKQDLVNELLATWLKDAATPTPPTAAPDMKAAARFVRRASVRAENGTLSIDFAIEI